MAVIDDRGPHQPGEEEPEVPPPPTRSPNLMFPILTKLRKW